MLSLLQAYPAAEGFLSTPPDRAQVRSVLARLHAGDQLGPFRIASLIGAGGMGEVYRATDTRLDREVAIKVLPRASAVDAAGREAFEREARAISKLTHPRISTLYDVGIGAVRRYRPSTTWSWSWWMARRWPRASRADRSRSIRRWPSRSRSPTRSRPLTRPAWSTATSSPRTSCSRGRARSCSTSAWRACSTRWSPRSLRGTFARTIRRPRHERPSRDAAVHGARAAARRGGRCAHRSVRVRRGALRDADRQPGVRRRLRGRARRGDPRT